MNKGHPCEKPLELMTWCIGLAGDVQTILDPFAGSCTTARAAKDLGRKCVCIEREERYCEIGARRMQQEVMDLRNMQTLDIEQTEQSTLL
jgi:site-specific DNA-methyltransferase (adenine-specific)